MQNKSKCANWEVKTHCAGFLLRRGDMAGSNSNNRYVWIDVENKTFLCLICEKDILKKTLQAPISTRQVVCYHSNYLFCYRFVTSDSGDCGEISVGPPV